MAGLPAALRQLLDDAPRVGVKEQCAAAATLVRRLAPGAPRPDVTAALYAAACGVLTATATATMQVAFSVIPVLAAERPRDLLASLAAPATLLHLLVTGPPSTLRADATRDGDAAGSDVALAARSARPERRLALATLVLRTRAKHAGVGDTLRADVGEALLRFAQAHVDALTQQHAVLGLWTEIPALLPQRLARNAQLLVIAWLAAAPERRSEQAAAVTRCLAFLDVLWSRAASAAARTALQQEAVAVMFRMLASIDASPGTAMAQLLDHVPVQLIGSTTPALMDAAAVTDDAIACAMLRMVRWRPYTRRLAAWLIGMASAMQRGTRFRLLIRMTKACVEQIVATVLGDAESAAAGVLLLRHFLLGYQHAPDVFHAVLPQVPALIDAVSAAGGGNGNAGDGNAGDGNTSEASPAQSLAQLLRCLMFHFSGYPTRYLPVVQALAAAGLEARADESDSAYTQLLRQASWTHGRAADALGAAEERSATGLTGLVNMGNTCYINSYLQALFMTQALRAALLDDADVPLETGIAAQGVAHQLRRVFAMLQLTQRAAVAPQLLRAALPTHFQTSEQQDAAEFARCLLDQLEETSSAHKALVQRVFAGSNTISIRCNDCGAASCTQEPWLDLVLPVPTTTSTDTVSVAALLRNVYQPEAMCGDNRYACASCGERRDATRTVALQKLPQHLVLTLNRFEYDVTARARRKVLTNVAYPLVLDVHAVVDASGGVDGGGDDSSCYDLYAVIVHAGTSASHGHYYCYARPSDTAHTSADWYLFNDSYVGATRYEQFSQTSATFKADVPYVLMYRRRSADLAVATPAALHVARPLADFVAADNAHALLEREEASAAAARRRGLFALSPDVPVSRRRDG